MLRFILLAAVFSILAPFAAACNCGSGGACHCNGVCSCAGHLTSPANEIVALALGAPTTVHVGVDDFFFTGDATIHVGDTVQWDWINGGHTVTSVIGSADQFDSGYLFSGSYSHTFMQEGTFVYYCLVHAIDNGDGTAEGMAAKVTVLAVPEPASSGLALALTMACLTHRHRRSRDSAPAKQ
jgi:plastocyanin